MGTLSIYWILKDGMSTSLFFLRQITSHLSGTLQRQEGGASRNMWMPSDERCDVWLFEIWMAEYSGLTHDLNYRITHRFSVDLFLETSSLCKAPKKKCQNHINWERLRRAEIDMERVRDLMDLEDLYEEERTIRQGMASRAGVLGLMLHSTIDHDELARQVSQMQSQQQQQQQQQQHQLQQNPEKAS